MYRVRFKLTPWPRGGIHVSRIHGVIFEERRYFLSRDDTVRREAKIDAETIRKQNCLEYCDVVEITEITERQVVL